MKILPYNIRYSDKMYVDTNIVIGDATQVQRREDIPFTVNLSKGFGIPFLNDPTTITPTKVPMFLYDASNRALIVSSPITKSWNLILESREVITPYIIESLGNGYVGILKNCDPIGDYSIELQSYRASSDAVGSGDYCVTIGENNKNATDKSVIIGQNDVSEFGAENIIIGRNSETSGNKSILIGNAHKNQSNNSILLGDNISNAGDNSVLIGKNITNDKDNVLILSPDSNSLLFVDGNGFPRLKNSDNVLSEEEILDDNVFSFYPIESTEQFRFVQKANGVIRYTDCAMCSGSPEPPASGDYYAKFFNNNCMVYNPSFSLDGYTNYAVEFKGRFYESSIPSHPDFKRHYTFTTPFVTSLKSYSYGYGYFGDSGSAVIFVGPIYRISAFRRYNDDQVMIYIEYNYWYERYYDHEATNVAASEIFDGKLHEFKVERNQSRIIFYKDGVVLFDIENENFFTSENIRDEIFIGNDRTSNVMRSVGTSLFEFYNGKLIIDGADYSKWDIPIENADRYTVSEIEDSINDNNLINETTSTTIDILKDHKAIKIDTDEDIIDFKFPFYDYDDGLTSKLMNYVKFEAFMDPINQNITEPVVLFEGEGDETTRLCVLYSPDIGRVYIKYGNVSITNGVYNQVPKEELFDGTWKTIAIQFSVDTGVIYGGVTIGISKLYNVYNSYDTGDVNYTLPETGTIFSSYIDNSFRIKSLLRNFASVDVDEGISRLHEFDLDADLVYSDHKIIRYTFPTTNHHVSEIRISNENMIISYDIANEY